jgi:putative transcriptional regulator
MSKVLKNVHDSMKDLHEIGLMSDLTMREFDALCLPPVRDYTGAQVVKIRRSVKASQAVFAAFLNVGKSTVAAWEQGTKKPSGAAARLLDIVERKGLDAIA